MLSDDNVVGVIFNSFAVCTCVMVFIKYQTLRSRLSFRPPRICTVICVFLCTCE